MRVYSARSSRAPCRTASWRSPAASTTTSSAISFRSSSPTRSWTRGWTCWPTRRSGLRKAGCAGQGWRRARKANREGSDMAEQSGSGEKETRKAWNDVGEHFSDLGRRFRDQEEHDPGRPLTRRRAGHHVPEPRRRDRPAGGREGIAPMNLPEGRIEGLVRNWWLFVLRRGNAG